ncbi:MAG: GAF domain-containing protein [Cyanosarcina radialis HA8281-LM2]|jgi:GAF domain-containing protein|nr:GAF domain-containing protein [Cyanosarcina radialis HA8281-LM2]
MQPNSAFSQQQVEPSVATRPSWQKISRQIQALALAIAIFITPGWGNKTSAARASDGEIWAQNPSTATDRTDRPANDSSEPPQELPLVLIIETVVAALLLIGLIAAYLANRARTRQQIAATLAAEELERQKLHSADVAVARLTKQGQFIEPTSAYLPAAIEVEASITSQVLKEIALRLRQCLYLEDLLNTAVKEVRRTIATDRVLIYSLNPTNWEGTVVAESVSPEWAQTIGLKIDDPCFRHQHAEMYKQGRIRSINNIYEEPGLTDCHIKLLEQFAVKANLIAPILRNEQLLGLMMAHQCSGARVWESDEIDLFARLALQIGLSIDQVNFLESQEKEVERAQLLRDITLKLRQTLSLEELLKIAVKEVRRAIKTDRVVIYSLDPDYLESTVVAESVAASWPQIVKLKIDDPCLKDQQMERYKYGYVRAIDNIYEEPTFTECYIKMLEQFDVKAQLVAPILKTDRLFGLLIAHQCDRSHHWEKPDIDLFSQLATQVGFAVGQVSLLEQMD